VRLRFTLLALVAAMTLALGSLVTGCHSAAKPSAVATKHYPIRGVVVELDATNKSVLLKHESIPGFMEAMTMAYRLSDPTVMSELHPGDKITATLVTDQDADGPTNMRLTDIVVIAQARPEDVAIGISTSGGSRNIIAALQEAKKRNLLTVALLGYDGGEIKRKGLADFPIVVNCDYIPRIQEVQASIYHVIRESLQVLSQQLASHHALNQEVLSRGHA